MENIVSLSQLDVVNGVYTYADYLTWKFEQTVELIKGKIMPMAAPSRRHQGISMVLSVMIYTALKDHKCKAYAAPFDVRLYDIVKSKKANKEVFSVIQPDISIICDLKKLDEKGCLGALDLIIEILSPGNSSKEMKTKKLLYEESGVKEYLIFDPEHENVFQFHLNEKGFYDIQKIYVDDEILTSIIFPDLSIDLTEIFSSN